MEEEKKVLSASRLIRALRYVERARLRQYLQLESANCARVATNARLIRVIEDMENLLQKVGFENELELGSSKQSITQSEALDREAEELACKGFPLLEAKNALKMFSFSSDFVPKVSAEEFLLLVNQFMEGKIRQKDLLILAQNMHVDFVMELAGVSKREARRTLIDCDYHGDLAVDALKLAKERDNLDESVFHSKVKDFLTRLSFRTQAASPPPTPEQSGDTLPPDCELKKGIIHIKILWRCSLSVKKMVFVTLFV